MKKIFLWLISLMLIASTLVAAYELVQVRPNKFSEELDDYYKISVQYHKGWNIIPLDTGFYGVYDAIEYNNAEALNQWRYSWQYIYLPQENKYVGIKDNKNGEPEIAGISSLEQLQTKLDGNYVNEMNRKLAGKWVYFTKDVVINYYTSPGHTLQSGGEYPSYGPGWDFFVVPIQLSTGELEMGDCIFDKIYYWDSALQNWQKLTISQMRLMVGNGFVVHTQDSCVLGRGLQPGIPPALPN